MRHCGKCGTELIKTGYPKDHKYHYDGWSELQCLCGYRVGRWCRQVLGDGMVEKPHCSGDNHPRIFLVEQGSDFEYPPLEL